MEDDRIELFDVVHDIGEERDLASQNPALLRIYAMPCIDGKKAWGPSFRFRILVTTLVSQADVHPSANPRMEAKKKKAK